MKFSLWVKSFIITVVFKVYPIYKICLLCFAMAFITVETTEIQTPDVMAIIHEILINLDPITIVKGYDPERPTDFIH
jgi:hypothetical protein